MTTIPVPGTALSTMEGVFGTEPFVCTAHWKFDGLGDPWTQADINLLASTINASWGTRIAPLANAVVVLQRVNTVDLGPTLPSLGTSNVSHAGTSTAGTSFNSATAMVVSRRIPARYKGGHSRIYLPIGCQGNIVTESQWNTAFVTSAENAWTALVSDVRTAIPAIAGAQVSEVVPLYNYSVINDTVHQRYIRKRESLKAVHIIAEYHGKQTMGTQRKRLVTG